MGLEEQVEEKEVLASIYEGDDNFSVINDTTYQYKVSLWGCWRLWIEIESQCSNTKVLNFTFLLISFQYGEEGNHRSFVVEVEWVGDYPDVAPKLNLDLFYNKHM